MHRLFQWNYGACVVLLVVATKKGNELRSFTSLRFPIRYDLPFYIRFVWCGTLLRLYVRPHRSNKVQFIDVLAYWRIFVCNRHTNNERMHVKRTCVCVFCEAARNPSSTQIIDFCKWTCGSHWSTENNNKCNGKCCMRSTDFYGGSKEIWRILR